MNQYNRQAQELDRRENGERKGARLKIGSAGHNEHDRFLADLLEETARVLKDLDAAGGHDEAHTDVQREAMTDLIRQHLVNRTTYKDGLVIYEITEAGRAYVRGLSF